MAATPVPPPPLNASFSPFDIFNDGGAARSTPPPTNPGLPGGPCNFVDLTHGPNGAKCGCRRFWGRQVAGAGNFTMDQMGWCMCSHHACFHDDAHNIQGQSALAPAPAPAPAPAMDNMPGQENEKPRSNRAPLSPIQDFASFQMPNSLGMAAMDFTALDIEGFSSHTDLGAALLQPNSQEPLQDGDSFPDTLSWKNVISTQGGRTSLPPFPSQCLLPESQSASTTASSQVRYLQPFEGKGLNTMSSVPPKDRDSETLIPRTGTGIEPMASTGNKRGFGRTPADAVTLGSEAATHTPRPGRAMGPPPPSFVSAGRDAETLDTLADTVNGHERRLERLETGSIYNIAQEECSERHDLADLRATELESRMDDVEKRLDGSISVAGSRRTTQHDGDDTDTTISVLSGPGNAPMLAADRAALNSQLAALQSRVNQLEASSLPSYSSPWELEVVFLPFALKGIWQEAQDFKTPRLSGGRDEWTQLPNTNSRATPDPQTLAAYDEWAGQDSGWLLPRACVPGRMIDQRLRSRGLIKTVSVRGGDARSVQIAVGNALESILRLIPNPASPRSPYVSDDRVDRFLGLQQSWVPLRKVHKDSRLRFLSPAELLTPVVWNSTFLMDNVVMKATGIHRLYITQPEAYLQDSYLLSSKGAESGWTWQRLRELTRVYPESQSSSAGSEVPEADALEDYWSYNSRLDEPAAPRQPSVSPIQSHERALAISRASDGSTDQFFTGPSNPVISMRSPIFTRGQSPLFQRGQSPLVQRSQSPLIQRERLGSHPPSIRVGSVQPNNTSILPSPHSSRRVSSYAILPSPAGPGYQRHSSPLVTGRPSPRLSLVANPNPMSVISKHRRRNTRSPSVRLHNTPRYSHRSFTRSPSVTPFFQNQIVGEPLRGERRTTPFAYAYATPHSNAPPEYPPPRVLSRSNSRSVQVLADEDDEDMNFDDDDDDDDDRGSLTDDDVDVYQDERDMLDDLESVSDHHPTGQHGPRQDQLPPSSSPPQGPEDEVWPGIEDNEMSNVNPLGLGDKDDARSDVSSVPSEYPSTQRAWRLPTVGEGREMTHGLEGDELVGPGFRIHVNESEEPAVQNQW